MRIKGNGIYKKECQLESTSRVPGVLAQLYKKDGNLGSRFLTLSTAWREEGLRPGLGGISALPGRPFSLGIPQAAALKPGPETQAGREPGIIVAQTHPAGAG